MRFPVKVQSNALRPPVLQNAYLKPGSSAGHCSTTVAQPIYKIMQSAPEHLWDGHLQQQQQQQQQAQAPWKVSKQRSATSFHPAIETGAPLSAGTRAAGLLRTLLHVQHHPSDAQTGIAAGHDLGVPCQEAWQQQQQMNDPSTVPTAVIDTGPETKDAATETESAADGGSAPQVSGHLQRQSHHTYHTKLHNIPAGSPKKGPGLSRKCMALQRLQARSRTHRPGPRLPALTAEQPSQHAGPGAPAEPQRLNYSHQQLMQPGVVGAAATCSINTQELLQAESDEYTLDAVAATALQYKPQRRQQAPEQQPTASAPQQSSLPAVLADSIGSISLSSQPEAPPGKQTSAANILFATQQPQPLLLPCMLSHGPLMADEVQAGTALEQQQQQPVPQEDGSGRMTAVLAALVRQQQQQPASGESALPVDVVRSGQCAAVAATGQDHDQHQTRTPHPAVSYAALVAPAAAVSAGAGAAVQAPCSTARLPATTAAGPDHVSGTPPPAAGQAAVSQAGQAAELARLILGAFEAAGGIIAPDKEAISPQNNGAENDTTATGRAQQQQQQDLLPGLLAGLASRKFLSLEDYVLPDTENSAAVLQQDLQQQQLAVHEVFELPTTAQPHLGCCLASCPQRIASTAFMTSPTTSRMSPAAQHKPPKIPGSTRSRCIRQCRQVQAGVITSCTVLGAGRTPKSRRQSCSSKYTKVDGRSRSLHHRCHRHEGHRCQPSQCCAEVTESQARLAEVDRHGGLLSPPAANTDTSRLHELRQSRQVAQHKGGPLSEWASQQTRQLAHLWQQWNQQDHAHRQQQNQQVWSGAENVDPRITAMCGSTKPAAQQTLQQQVDNNKPASSASTGSRSAGRIPPAVYTADRYLEPQDAAPVVLDGAKTEAGSEHAAPARRMAVEHQQLSQTALAQQVKQPFYVVVAG